MIGPELLFFDEAHNTLCIDLTPEKHALVELSQLKALVDDSPYRQCAFLDNDIRKALNQLKHQAKGANKAQVKRIPLAMKVDGDCKLSVSADKMEVTATLTAPQGGRRIGFKELVAELQTLTIRNGLLKNAINNLLKKAESSSPGESISATIAKGKPAKHGRDAQLERLVKLNRERLMAPKVLDNGKVDMRDLGEIVTVQAGDEVMRKHDAEPGIDGYNVSGDVLKAKPGKDRKLKAGKGTAQADGNPNLLLASASGQPKETKDGLEIVEILTLKEVNIGTGHVNYHGNVVINGNVEEEMRIEAGGDITVNGFMDGELLKAGGDIVIGKGVIGKQANNSKLSTHLEAAGEIHVAFAQYARLKAGGNILVQTQLIHCQTYSGNDLTVGVPNGKKGDIVGGLTQAYHSINCINLGSRAATQSRIQAGLGVQQLRIMAKEYHQREQALLAESYKLRQAINKASMAKDRTEEDRKKLVAQFTRAQQQNSARLAEAQLLLAETNEKLSNFLDKIAISVSHCLYPQAEMEIGTHTLTSDREHGPSKVFNDGNTLQIDPLVNPS